MAWARCLVGFGSLELFVPHFSLSRRLKPAPEGMHDLDAKMQRFDLQGVTGRAEP